MSEWNMPDNVRDFDHDPRSPFYEAPPCNRCHSEGDDCICCESCENAPDECVCETDNNDEESPQ